MRREDCGTSEVVDARGKLTSSVVGRGKIRCWRRCCSRSKWERQRVEEPGGPTCSTSGRSSGDVKVYWIVVVRGVLMMRYQSASRSRSSIANGVVRVRVRVVMGGWRVGIAGVMDCAYKRRLPIHHCRAYQARFSTIQTANSIPIFVFFFFGSVADFCPGGSPLSLC
jgi:hypothetical protein